MIGASLGGVGDRGIPFINPSTGLARLLINHFPFIKMSQDVTEPPQNLLSHNTLLECLDLGLLRVTLHLAYGFALLIHCLPAPQSFSDGIYPDLMNCQIVDSYNDYNIPSSRL